MWQEGAALRRGEGASHCGGFSRAWAAAVAACGLSSRGSQAPELELSSCRAQAPRMPCGLWNLPGPGIEPIFPASGGDSFF